MDLNDLSTLEYFTELDKYFASYISRLSSIDDINLLLSSLLVSNRTGKGDICLDIPSIAGKNISEVFNDLEYDYPLPDEREWLDKLQNMEIVGKPEERKPLILDSRGRLYIYRYWNYEKRLAENIKSRLNIYTDECDTELLKNGMARLFPLQNKETDRQRVAAVTSAVRKFCVISGGPGTGKTSTVVKILVLLIEQAISKNFKPSIALAAPTGKAAARLKESIKLTRDALACSDDIKSIIPDDSYTIHRLLGPIKGSPYFRYNSSNPILFDIVIIDESSMADLALLSKLFDAVPLGSHLIILGDKDQLSSVEAGAALGDICDTGTKHGYTEFFSKMIREISPAEKIPVSDEPPIADSIIILNKSYRFGDRSGIGIASRAVREGNFDEALRVMKDPEYTDIDFIDIENPAGLNNFIENYIESGFGSYLQAGSIEESFFRFFDYSILCAVRSGPWGVYRINKTIEKFLKRRGLINPEKKFYNGRPVIIARNDYHLKIFNGDIGLIFKDNESDGKSRFFCQTPDGNYRKILPLKLPEHETVFATTVHKSQGSEYNNVLLILPDRDSPVLTRELLYTAITRARTNVKIAGCADIIKTMIERPTMRKSGLRDALWEC